MNRIKFIKLKINLRMLIAEIYLDFLIQTARISKMGMNINFFKTSYDMMS